jgi:hypothetical protein
VDSMNLYEYVVSNPVNPADPVGLCSPGQLKGIDDMLRDVATERSNVQDQLGYLSSDLQDALSDFRTVSSNLSKLMPSIPYGSLIKFAATEVAATMLLTFAENHTIGAGTLTVEAQIIAGTGYGLAAAGVVLLAYEYEWNQAWQPAAGTVAGFMSTLTSLANMWNTLLVQITTLRNDIEVAKNYMDYLRGYREDLKKVRRLCLEEMAENNFEWSDDIFDEFHPRYERYLFQRRAFTQHQSICDP